MSAHDDYDVVVLGGGHNGLVAAGYLARAGLNVIVLERRDIVGGACMTEELFPGYRFSACSYICYLLQSQIIEDLELRKYGFEVYAHDPHAFSHSRTAAGFCCGRTSSGPSRKSPGSHPEMPNATRSGLHSGSVRLASFIRTSCAPRRRWTRSLTA